MKFGLRLPSFALGSKTASLQEMGAYLRRAEDLGFDCALSIDHLLLTPPAYACTWLEPVALLAALAGVTRTIKLGTMVLVLPLRNPASFAKEWATLDVLSGGRTILGVGVGWHEEEFALMSVPYKERGRRMDEMLEAVTALWAGDKVTYHGKYYQFDKLSIDPKPVQTPHPPIWIGGGTQPFERVYGQTVTNIDPVLRRIAKYARTWVPHSSATAEMVRGDWEKIRRFMDDCGRKPDEMAKVYSNFVYVLDRGERPESAAPYFRVYSGMDPPYWQEYYLLGEAEELAEKIRGKLAALGGVEYVVLNPLNWGMEQLERLAGEVLPRVALA
jgi:alkanesulfonate monooxygenase